MNNLDVLLEQLKTALDNNEEIKEYLSLKEIVENDPELKKMRQEIARLTNEGKVEEKNNLIETYNSHPIVVNYNESRTEVINLLNQIKTILSD